MMQQGLITEEQIEEYKVFSRQFVSENVVFTAKRVLLVTMISDLMGSPDMSAEDVEDCMDDFME